MSGSMKVAKLFGIPVFVHWSFLLLFFWIAYLTIATGFGLKFFFWYSALFLGIFICVVFHEFGHALTARRYGVKTRDIILSPIGGIARLEKLPEKPFQEFLVALAGPLVNIGIFLVLLSIQLVFDVGDLEVWREPDFPSMMNILLRGSFVSFMFTTLLGLNLGLAVFNMIPAFPMDGGRILRSLLAIPLKRVRATQIAVVIAQILAGFIFIWAISNGEIILGLISVFVFFAARQEMRMVRFDALLENKYVRDLVQPTFTRIYKFDMVQEATNKLKMGIERNFLVLESAENEKILGVLHEPYLVEAIKKNEEFTPVTNYLSDRYEPVRPEMNLKDLFHLMRKEGYTILPVINEEEQLLGKVDMQGLNNYLITQQKLGS